eukprot:1216863-Amphidinium_carterae.1
MRSLFTALGSGRKEISDLHTSISRALGKGAFLRQSESGPTGNPHVFANLTTVSSQDQTHPCWP